MAGTPLTLTGFVLSTTCEPGRRCAHRLLAGGRAGTYDNQGWYRLRGHQFANDAGRFVLETIVPGLSQVRLGTSTSKCTAPTGQCSPPGSISRASPGTTRTEVFHPDLVMDDRDTSGGKSASFDFSLNLG
jgi:protocatechuate 3,4-dioxygenase beta subunit